MDLIVVNKYELVRDMKVGGRLSCSDHEMVDPVRKEQGKRQDHRHAFSTSLKVCLEELHEI